MIQVRPNCFETNSSSSHSLVITKNELGWYTDGEAWEEIRYSCRDGIYSPWKDTYFGRHPFQILNSFEAKLRYAYACAPLKKGNIDKNGYRRYYRNYYLITKILKSHFPEYNGVKFRGSIGTDDNLLFGWLEKANISLWEFLTNKSIIVICDGDEYCIWTDLKKQGLIDKNNIKLAIPEKEWWEDLDEEDSDDYDDYDEYDEEDKED